MVRVSVILSYISEWVRGSGTMSAGRVRWCDWLRFRSWVRGLPLVILSRLVIVRRSWAWDGVDPGKRGKRSIIRVYHFYGLSRRGISYRVDRVNWHWITNQVGAGVEFRLWSGWCLVNWVRVKVLGLSPLDRDWS